MGDSKAELFFFGYKSCLVTNTVLGLTSKLSEGIRESLLIWLVLQRTFLANIVQNVTSVNLRY